MIVVLLSLAAAETMHRALPNGARVAASEVAGARDVALVVHVACGSADDPPDRRGLAHLVEHVAYTGSAHAPGGAGDAWIRAAGGETSAWTTADALVFAARAPREALPLLAYVESDRLGWPTPTGTSLAAQQAVVERERALRGAEAVLAAALGRLVHGPDHPYARSVLGERSGVARATVDELRRFTARCFRPDRLRVLVTGPPPVAALLEEVATRFAELPASPREEPPPLAWAPQPANTDGAPARERGEGPRSGRWWLPLAVYPPHLRVAWALPESATRIPLEAAAAVLGARLEGRGARVGWFLGPRGGRLELRVEKPGPVPVARLRAEAAALAVRGPSAAELAAWRGSARTRDLVRLEVPLDHAELRMSCWVEDGRPDCVEGRWAAREALSADEVRDAARRFLAWTDAVTLFAGPRRRLGGAALSEGP